MKILCVSQDVTSRQVLEHCFGERGHEVCAAENPKQAWQFLVREKEIASLYIDWTIGREEGLSLCRGVRDTDRKPYFSIIVFLSSEQKEMQ